MFGTAGPSQSDGAFASGVQATGETLLRDLDTIRQAMLLAVAPCSEVHRLRAADQIRHAESVIELWLLRADIFQYIAQDLGQMAAAQQITGLIPLFRDLVPTATARTTQAVRRPPAFTN